MDKAMWVFFHFR